MEYTDGTVKFKVSRLGVVSDALKSKLNDKQDKLIFDSIPTTGSTNPVTSDGIKNSVDSINSAINGITNQLTVTPIPITINEELVRRADAFRLGNIVFGSVAINKVSGLSGDQLLISGLPVPVTYIINGFMTPWKDYYRYYIDFDGKMYEHYISGFNIVPGNAVEFTYMYICA